MASRSKFNGWAGREIDDVERRVRTYLTDKARNNGIYVKSKRVAEDLDLSTRRAAQAIHVLRRDCNTLEIKEWSGGSANAATWHVEIVEGPTPFGAECPTCESLVSETAEDCPHCGRRLDR